jgi:4'-phosphopantetheinyl transferase
MAGSARSPGCPDPQLWLVDLDAGSDALRQVAARLDLVPDAVADIAAGSDIAVRRQAARAALRLLLAAHCGLDLARQPFRIAPAGKPSLPVPAGRERVEFSLAHSEGLALVGLSWAGAIGVDIEAFRAVGISAQRREMLEDAASALAPGSPLPAGPPDARFVRAWVRLEAMAKATGEGISALLGRLGVRGRQPGAADTTVTGPLVADIALDVGAAAAIALFSPHPTGPWPPSVRRLPLDRSTLEAMALGRG